MKNNLIIGIAIAWMILTAIGMARSELAIRENTAALQSLELVE